MEVCQKIKLLLLYSMGILSLGTYPKQFKSRSQRQVYTPTLFVALVR